VQRSSAKSKLAKVQPAPLNGDFQRTREENAREIPRDYVEMISELIATTGVARVTELARRLGVTHVTVHRNLQRLQRSGLVTALPYRTVFLTDAGRKLSEDSRRCHEIVVRFLISLGIPERAARADAEGMEHHISPATLEAFLKHLEKRG
jgi:DtxR family manganese transport transcriptional regulator